MAEEKQREHEAAKVHETGTKNKTRCQKRKGIQITVIRLQTFGGWLCSIPSMIL